MQTEEISFKCPICKSTIKDEQAEDVTFDAEGNQMYHISCLIMKSKDDQSKPAETDIDVTTNLGKDIEIKGDK